MLLTFACAYCSFVHIHTSVSFFRFALQSQSFQGKLYKRKCGRKEIESIFRPRSEHTHHCGFKRKMCRSKDLGAWRETKIVAYQGHHWRRFCKDIMWIEGNTLTYFWCHCDSNKNTMILIRLTTHTLLTMKWALILLIILHFLYFPLWMSEKQSFLGQHSSYLISTVNHNHGYTYFLIFVSLKYFLTVNLPRLTSTNLA